MSCGRLNDACRDAAMRLQPPLIGKAPPGTDRAGCPRHASFPLKSAANFLNPFTLARMMLVYPTSGPEYGF
jgi:hypothetical protein